MPYLQLADTKLWCQDDGTGEAIVFLHAASGCCEIWRPQVEFFRSAGFRCIRYDRAGWGQSIAVSRDGTTQCASHELRELVDTLGLERFHLVAVAAGGPVALDFALCWPEALLSLTLACTVGGVEDEHYLTIQRQFWTNQVFALPPEIRELGKAYRDREPVGVRSWLDIERGGRQDGSNREDVICQEITLENLSQLEMDVLLVAGDDDQLSPPALMQILADALNGSKLVILPGVGHSPFWEAPDDCNRLLRDFLRRARG